MVIKLLSQENLAWVKNNQITNSASKIPSSFKKQRNYSMIHKKKISTLTEGY